MTSPAPETPTPEPRRPRRGRPKGRFKYSKRVVKAAGATRALKASIEVYKDGVAAGVGERLAPELAAGEVLPDHALSLELVGRSWSASSSTSRLASGATSKRRRGAPPPGAKPRSWRGARSTARWWACVA